MRNYTRLLLSLLVYLAFSETSIGQAWELISETNTQERIFSITALDSMTVWAVGLKPGNPPEPYIKHSVDGGQSWAEQASAIAKPLVKVHFFNPETGWILNDRDIQKTVDGGDTWYKVEVDTFTFNPAFLDFSFADLNTGYAIGDGGILIKSTDQGESWHQLPFTESPFGAFYTAIDFFNADTGIAVGGLGTNQLIMRTVNGGDDWSEIDVGVDSIRNGRLKDVFFVNETTVYAVGIFGKVLCSQDAGLNWQIKTRITYAGFNTDNYAVCFISPDTGWVANGYLTGTTTANLHFTSDGGVSWYRQLFNTNPNEIFFKEITFTDDGTGWIGGYQFTNNPNFNSGELIYRGTGDIVTSIRSLPESKHAFVVMPNPFISSVVLSLKLEEKALVALNVYNTAGQIMTRISYGELQKGLHQLKIGMETWDNGLYICILQINDNVFTEKMMKSSK